MIIGSKERNMPKRLRLSCLTLILMPLSPVATPRSANSSNKLTLLSLRDLKL